MYVYVEQGCQSLQITELDDLPSLALTEESEKLSDRQI